MPFKDIFYSGGSAIACFDVARRLSKVVPVFRAKVLHVVRMKRPRYKIVERFFDCKFLHVANVAVKLLTVKNISPNVLRFKICGAHLLHD